VAHVKLSAAIVEAKRPAKIRPRKDTPSPEGFGEKLALLSEENRAIIERVVNRFLEDDAS
jgi:hypothetical protein